ncbi:MAG: ferritin-like domain-containing protein [Chitinophagaceae bacterium]|nr:ferritin-like domain-containing protein [Chitinophagaceae bacterium]
MAKTKSTNNTTTAQKSNGLKKSNGSPSNETSEKSLFLELFVDELKDIYWAEKHLQKALPKMEKAATTAELKKAFAQHLVVTKKHATRLEDIFGMLGKKAQAKKCEAMDGLTKEGEEIIENTEKGTLTRDVGLIMAGQKVEHYEIATYGSLAQLAKTIGKNDIASLLEQTLAEEKEADETLTGIAENNINLEATKES